MKAAAAFAAASQRPPPPAPRWRGSPGGRLRPRLVLQKSVLPQLDIKLLFAVGSAHDPAGKEGLAALTAAMIAEAGSKAMTIDQIDAVLYPMAGSWRQSVDKEMTTFTGSIHRDYWSTVPRDRPAAASGAGVQGRGFQAAEGSAEERARQDLRSDNEEELGKERLQTNIFRGTPYGHVRSARSPGSTPSPWTT